MNPQRVVSQAEVMAHTGLDENIVGIILDTLIEKGGIIQEAEMAGELRYRVVRPASRVRF